MIRKVLFSSVVFVVLLEVALRIGGWALSLQARNTELNKTDEFIILTLGESTTDSFISSWPVQLEKILRQQFPDRSIRVINEGKGGTTTAFISARLSDQLKRYNPNMVITMMGVNDGDSYLMYKPDDRLSGIVFFIEDFRVRKFSQALYRFLTTGTAYAPQVYTVTDLNAEGASLGDDPMEQALQEERKLRSQGNLVAAERMYESLLGNPKYDQSVIALQLGYLRLHSGNVLGAKTAFTESMQASPQSAHPLIGLGIIARDEGRIDDAISLLGKALSIDENAEPSAYLTLATLFKEKNNIPEAIKMYEKGLAHNNNTDHIIGALTTLYKRMGMTDAAIAQQVYTISPGMVSSFRINTLLSFSELTRYHYRLIHDILVRNHVAHVAMQYPTLDISSIQEMILHDTSVLYVSNKENFEEALRQHPYEYYFVDRFGGMWGHTTKEGDRLIAAAAAEAVGARLDLLSK